MSRLTADKAAKKAATKAASTAASEAKSARDALVPHLVTARGAVVPALGHARDSVLPALEHARKAMEGTLKDEVLPRVSAGLAATEPHREEAVRRGTAALAALKGQVEAPKPAKGRRRAGKMLVIAAIGAAGVAAWRAWRLPHDSDDWVHSDSFTSGAVPSTGAEPAVTPADGGAANGQRPATVTSPR